LLCGAYFDRLFSAIVKLFLVRFRLLTHIPTHTAKKAGGHSGKFRVKYRAMVERKGLETPQWSQFIALHTVCNQQVRGSSPFTSSKLGGPAR
jgi:hypothetical protein